eukprot:scaffold7.g3558.t1
MASASSPGRRREQDVTKLMMSDWKVELVEDNISEFHVEFKGPPDSFVNRIFHPNIDEAAGSVCLDVINQTWSPMFDLLNVFESFLPQLLLYPNPSDPLNGEAAALHMRDPAAYQHKVREYVQRYAKPEDVQALDAAEKHGGGNMSGSESDNFLSSSDEEDEQQAAGRMES